MKNVSASREMVPALRQMMDPVSQVALEPPMSRATIDTAEARWHVVWAQRRTCPGAGTRARALINLGRWTLWRRAAHDRRLARV